MLSSGTEHMTAQEYREYLEKENSAKGNKYKNKCLWYDGLLFQSQKELDCRREKLQDSCGKVY